MKTLLLLLLAATTYANGPKYHFEDSKLNDEFDNAYHDIGNVLNGSTVTIRNLVVSTITVTSALSGLGLGKVKQVIFQTEATGGSTTSSSFVVAGASMTITPTSATSRIAIFGLGIMNVATSTDGHPGSLGIGKNGTELFARSAAGAVYITGGTNSSHAVELSIFYVDSPGTTSPTTYSLMITSGAGSTINFGGAAATGSRTYIMLVEIGA